MGCQVREEAGHTLLELVVALTLLALVMLPFLTGLGTAARGVEVVEGKLLAARLLEREAEKTKAELRSQVETAGEMTYGDQFDDDYAGSGLRLERRVEPVVVMADGAGRPAVARVRLRLSRQGRELAEVVFLFYRWGF